jgi:hypothetical protein
VSIMRDRGLALGNLDATLIAQARGSRCTWTRSGRRSGPARAHRPNV